MAEAFLSRPMEWLDETRDVDREDSDARSQRPASWTPCQLCDAHLAFDGEHTGTPFYDDFELRGHLVPVDSATAEYATVVLGVVPAVTVTGVYRVQNSIQREMYCERKSRDARSICGVREETLWHGT